MFEQVYATDIESAYLKHLEALRHEHPGLTLLIDDITASKLPPQSFDLILCSEVVEHIANSELALMCMRRLLSPGGVLILSTPQPYSPLELAAKIAFLPGIISLVRIIYGEPILDAGHINLMTSREIARQMREAGYEVSVTHKSGLYLPLIAEFAGEWGLKVEKWLEGRLRGRRLDSLLWVQYYVAHPKDK
jgi:2-polyprenyl-3-methyl-5-hydroxy-6-metoxy-1,4-benzoquinol methylase